MPRDLERKLRKQAREQGLTGKRADRYIYGTLNKISGRRTKGKKRRNYG